MSVKVTSNIDDKRPEKMERAIEVALQSIGIHMEAAAARYCPVDTGRLRGSITWATANHGKSMSRGPAKSGDRVDQPRRPRMVYIGTNVEYAAHVEYGTKRHPRAQSFLRLSFDTEKPTIRRIFDATIKRIVIDG